MSLGDVFRMFLERFSKTEKMKEYVVTNFLVFNTHIWRTNIENISAEIRWVKYVQNWFPRDVLKTSTPGCHFRAFRGHLVK